MNEEKTTRRSRREFLYGLGIGGAIVGLGYQLFAALRSLVPNVSYDPPTRVKLGTAADFQDGMTFLADERLYVFRDGKSFHAISAVCTHLGCTVRAEALADAQVMQVDGAPLKVTHRFLCPCHGSKYTGDGTNVAGPAPRPLAWHPLQLSPDDGQLVVDLAEECERNFRLNV